MKIIHTADLHLESRMESNFSTEQAKRRRGELLESFEKMVEYGDSIGVSIILISGDMYDKSSIKKSAIKRVFEIISAYSHITFLYLRGNHDCEAFESELMADECPDNIRLFESEKWISYDFDEVVVTGREISDANVDSLYSELVLDTGRVNIVMLHGQEANYEGKDKTHIINIRSLQNKYIDYLALGHIHSYKQEKLGERGIYCYPGCPEPRGFDECGKKGFVVLTVENGEIQSEFVSLQKRTFHEIEIEVDASMEMPDVLKKADECLEGISSNDVCKLVVKGYKDMDQYIDVERIEERFLDRFFFVKVYDRTLIKINFESFAFDRTLKGGFVRLVQSLDMDEEKKAEIIDVGIRAIMGEEI